MASSRPPRHHRAASNPLELRVYATELPRHWTTLDVYKHFERFGNISRIELQDRGTRDKCANLFFRPTPVDIRWVNKPVQGIDSAGVQRSISCQNESHPVFMHKMPSGKLSLPERMSIPLQKIDFGVMRTEANMASFFTAYTSNTSRAQLTMDLQMKALFLEFPIQVAAPATAGTAHTVEHVYRIRMNPAQVCEARCMMPEGTDYNTITLSVDSPPLVFRKTRRIYETHDPKATYWNDRKTWLRQTDIDFNPAGRKSSVELSKHDACIDIGRWLTYHLTFDTKLWKTSQLQNSTLR